MFGLDFSRREQNTKTIALRQLYEFTRLIRIIIYAAHYTDCETLFFCFAILTTARTKPGFTTPKKKPVARSLGKETGIEIKFPQMPTQIFLLGTRMKQGGDQPAFLALHICAPRIF